MPDDLRGRRADARDRRRHSATNRIEQEAPDMSPVSNISPIKAAFAVAALLSLVAAGLAIRGATSPGLPALGMVDDYATRHAVEAEVELTAADDFGTRNRRRASSSRPPTTSAPATRPQRSNSRPPTTSAPATRRRPSNSRPPTTSAPDTPRRRSSSARTTTGRPARCGDTGGRLPPVRCESS